MSRFSMKVTWAMSMLLDTSAVNLDINGKLVTWRFNGVQEVISLSEMIEGAPDIKVYVLQTERFENRTAAPARLRRLTPPGRPFRRRRTP